MWLLERDERGVALVMTMMASLVLVALIGALVPLASTEAAVAANHRRAVEGLYAAEAALEAVVSELGSTQVVAAGWDDVLAGSQRSRFWATSLVPRSPDGTTIDLGAATRRLRRSGAGESGSGRGREWRLFAHGSLASLLRSSPDYGPWIVVVWLADDSADRDGDTARDSNDAVVAHAAAFGPRRAHRAIQATLVRQSRPGVTPGQTVHRVRLRAWGIVQ